MHSGMMGRACYPIDMAIGLGSRSSAKKAGGSDGFDTLMSLFPQMASPESGSVPGLVPGKTPGAFAETGMAGDTQLMLPNSLARLLGLNALFPSEPTKGMFPSEASEAMLFGKADLLAADDGNDQTLYLRIAPDGEGAFPDSKQVEGEAQEMILPMRLRTVEQCGNRILADAELLTATGKEIPIRLKLELAGVQADGLDRGEGSLTDVEANSPAGKINLPRMLSELGVKLLVIENAGETSGQTSRAVFPGTPALNRNIPGLKNQWVQLAGFSGSETGQTAGSADADPASMTGGDGYGQRADFSDGNPAVFQQLAKNAGGREMSVTPSQSGIDNGVSVLTSMVEPGIATPQPETTEHSAPVRFYDLDSKLDQLKRNPGQTIRVQLVPAKLGKMDLSIISHRGLVTVKLTLDSQAAKQAVEKNLFQLENRLTASGIRVDNFQISVDQSSKDEQFAGHYYSRQQGGYDNPHSGDNRRHMFDQRRMNQFNPAGARFDQVMVNCLA